MIAVCDSDAVEHEIWNKSNNKIDIYYYGDDISDIELRQEIEDLKEFYDIVIAPKRNYKRRDKEWN